MSNSNLDELLPDTGCLQGEYPEYTETELNETREAMATEVEEILEQARRDAVKRFEEKLQDKRGSR
jgi:hypothetical protein